MIAKIEVERFSLITSKPFCEVVAGVNAHRIAFLVVVNAAHAWFIHEHFRDHRRCELWGAPVFDVRSKQREDVFTQEAQEGVSIAPEACFRTESRFDRVEA